MKNLILSATLLICSFIQGKAQSIKYDYTIPILNDQVITEDHQVNDVFVTRMEGRYKITFYVKCVFRSC